MLGCHLGRCQVEAGDLGGQGIDVRLGQFAALLHFAEQLALGEFAHAQGVFDHRTAAIQLGSAFAAGDGHHVPVEIAGQALIEAQLLTAEVTAGLQVGEVEETEVHRLLDLVGDLAGQHDPGNMGFDHPERRGGMGIERRVLQGGNQELAHGRSL